MASDAAIVSHFVAEVVACDLDGTLLAPDLSYAPELPPALAHLRAAGIDTVFCTGRMFVSARKVAARLGLRQGLIVCYQGAMVLDLSSGERLLHTTMDTELAAEVVRVARALGRHVNAYIDDRLFVEDLSDWARRYAEHVEVELNVVPNLEEAVMRRPPTKLVLLTAAADAEQLLPHLQERWQDRLYVTRSQPEYIEIADATVSKSGALEWLCARDGLRRERVVACGDGMNDVDMLRWAGLGIAMAEATPPVRAAGDLVVPRADLPAVFEDLAATAVRLR